MSIKEDYKAAEQAMARLGKLRKMIREKNDRCHKKVDELFVKLEEQTKDWLQEVKTIEESLTEFTGELIYHGEFENSSTKVLSTGVITRRKSTSLKVADAKKAIARLLRKGLGDCVRVKQEVDKRAIKKLNYDPDYLAKTFGITTVEKVSITFEPSE